MIPDSAEWRGVVAAVKAAAHAPFLEGAPKDELLELYRDVGASQILEWLLEAPADHKVPRLVAWLSDQRHRPDAGFLAKLEERRLAAEAEVIASGDLGVTSGGMGDAPDPPTPTLREFVPPPAEPKADPDHVRRQLEALRSRSTPSGSTDDTMATSTGG